MPKFNCISIVLAVVFSSHLWAMDPACQSTSYTGAATVIAQDLLHFAGEKIDFLKPYEFGYKASCQVMMGASKDYQPQDGDVVFLGLESELYKRVAVSTNSWVSHVGVLMSEKNRRGEKTWYVYESSPLHGHKTPVCQYVGKARHYRFAVARANEPLTARDIDSLRAFLRAHYKEPYHLGFNYAAEGYQFCSKLVFQAYQNIGRKIGSFEPLGNLVDNFDEVSGQSGAFGPPMTKQQAVCFWESYFGLCRDSGRLMAEICQYFGGDAPDQMGEVIPRHRPTVTPDSQYRQALTGDGFTIVLDYGI